MKKLKQQQENHWKIKVDFDVCFCLSGASLMRKSPVLKD